MSEDRNKQESSWRQLIKYMWRDPLSWILFGAVVVLVSLVILIGFIGAHI